jgi:hypothetical protein
LPSDHSCTKRLSNRHFFAEQYGIAIHAVTCAAIEPLGEIPAFEFHDGRAAFFNLQARARDSEAVFRYFVPLRTNIEEDCLPHQTRLKERYTAGAISDVAHLVYRHQLDQRNPASGSGILDLDLEVLFRGKRNRSQWESRQHHRN